MSCCYCCAGIYAARGQMLNCWWAWAISQKWILMRLP